MTLPRLTSGGRSWFRVAIGVSLVLLTATGLRRFVEPGVLRGLMNPMFLGAEGNLATWWSGMLLFMTSLHAYDGAGRVGSPRPEVAKAWLIIAGLLLFLSADEVSSLHERISLISSDRVSSDWILLGLVALCLGAAALVALRRLWVARGERSAAIAIFVGFLILGSVAPQEYLEHRLTWTGPVVVALRTVVEEGTELLGMLVILRATVGNTAELGAEGGPVAFAFLRSPQRRTLLLACLAFLLLAAVRPGSIFGHPADWVAASTLLGAALVAARPLLVGGGHSSAWVRVTRAVACLAGSVAAGATDPIALVELGPFWFNVRLSVLALLAGLFAATLPGGTPRWRLRFAFIACAATLTLGVGIVWSLTLPVIYLFSQLLALVVFVIATREVDVAAPSGSAGAVELPQRA